MALQLSKCRVAQSIERQIAANIVITAEGAALVSVLENGVEVVKPSTGGAGEKFAGFAYAQVINATDLPQVDELIAPASGANTVTTVFTPLAGTLRVVANGTALTVGTPGTNANEYSISGSVITLHTSRYGQTVVVYYRYSPTLGQAKALFGDEFPGGPATSINGQVGVIEYGDVYTTEFETQDDWAGATAVKLSAAGLVSADGTGVTINARVISVPTAGSPFLGLRIAAL